MILSLAESSDPEFSSIALHHKYLGQLPNASAFNLISHSGQLRMTTMSAHLPYPLLLFVVVCIVVRPPSTSAMRLEYPVSEGVAAGRVIVNLANQFNIDQRSTSQSLQITNSHTSDGARYFAINTSTGELYVVEPPDRDILCEDKEDCIVELMIAHGDSRNPEVTTLRIRLLDVNDNAPQFPEKSIVVRVREEMDPRNVKKPLPTAFDPDLGQNGVKRYSIEGMSEDTMPFDVDMKDKAPVLVLHQKLDRERRANYNFRLLARDGGRPQRTGTLSVRVKVDDINDHAPEFEKSSYSNIIEENTAQGRTILTLKAVDKDEGDNGKVGYRIARARNREEMRAIPYFDVYNNNGEAKIVIKKAVDIDKRPNLYYKFKVVAFDHGSSPMESEVDVIIRVRDVNDDKPQIKISYLKKDGLITTRGLLMENDEKVFVAVVTVTDRDSGPGGIVSCKVGNDLFYLQDIQQSSGSFKSSEKRQVKKYKLLTRQGIDREKIPQISFTITCHDNAVAQKSMTKLVSTARVDLRIVDKNDEKPEFTEEQYTFHLRENLSKQDIEVQVGQVKAVDKDEGDNSKITYHLLDDGNNAFRIERQSGLIYAQRGFDREHTDQVMLVVKAVDNGSPHQQTTTAQVKVIIADVNDNAPVFKATDYHFTVVENSIALQVGHVEATDEDRDSNAEVEYRIIDENAETRKYFSINRHSGMIHLNSKLDRETKDQYVFHVIALDKPNPGQTRNTGTATVTVSVLDENDNPPQIFSPNNNEIKDIDDTEPIGKDLFTMRAIDPDEGVNGTVHYDVVRGAEGFFSIDKTAGIFYVMRKLEGIHNRIFSVVLVAMDNGREISLNSTVTVRIRVQSGDQSHLPPTDPEIFDSGETGRTLIVVAAIVLLLLVLAAVALLVMLKLRRNPNSSRRSNEDMKRKWKNGLVGKVSETYVCSRTGPKGQIPPHGNPSGGDDEKVDEYLLESAALRSKDLEANYNSLNFYKGDLSPDKVQPDHTYYEVAKSKEGSLDTNYAPFDKHEMSVALSDGDSAKRSPFLGDMRVPGLSDSEMTMVSAKRRQDKPYTPYIEASFV